MNRNLVVGKKNGEKSENVIPFKQRFFCFFFCNVNFVYHISKYLCGNEAEYSASVWCGTKQVWVHENRKAIPWNFPLLAITMWKWLIKTHLRKFNDILMMTRTSRGNYNVFQIILFIHLQFWFKYYRLGIKVAYTPQDLTVFQNCCSFIIYKL